MFQFLRDIEWGAGDLWPWAVGGIVVAVPLIVWAYLRTPVATRWRAVAMSLKFIAIAALLLCVLEPLKPAERPVAGANLFLVVADNSQSLQVKSRRADQNRGEKLKELLARDNEWRVRLGQQFDVRDYYFDSRIQAIGSFDELNFQGDRSSLMSSLATLGTRFKGRPVGGVLLFTDGNATDAEFAGVDWSTLPPLFPVVADDPGPAKDISVRLTSVRESNFEGTPVTLRAEVVTHGYKGRTLVGQVLDEDNKVLETLEVKGQKDGKPLEFRFKLKPERSGLRFYRMRVGAKQEWKQFDDPDKSSEATLANNERTVVVDRGGGPYRLLYVAGRPNWEFKFLQRSLVSDEQISMAGLIRIAKREARFDFRGRNKQQTNPLFKGFGNDKDEEAEKYDQPVMLRVGLSEDDTSELRDGFPKSKEELYRYHGLIIDDLEAGVFTQDQLSLIRDFVFQRGGGFLMLGGQESFTRGKYAKTPLEDLLPVYLDNVAPKAAEGYRMALTREGWLQPWVRVRSTEEEERKRLEGMPTFRTINRVQSHKPGATVLAYVTDGSGTKYPALVESANAGRGRAAALLLGDFWRWQLHRKEQDEEELGRAWRQTVRWLIADIPHRIDVDTKRLEDQPGHPIEISVTVRDKKFEPLDNAGVQIRVTGPDKKKVELTAEPSDKRPGVYVANFVPRAAGAFRASVHADAPDGSKVGTRDAGWVAEPAAEEFKSLGIDRTRLEEIAKKTGGRVVKAGELDRFVNRLEHVKVPVTEHYITPLWDRLSVFLFAIACLTCEWGIRRWKGLP